MKTIINKTRRPLAIRLSRGKVLRLGPGKEGQIATQDVDLASVKTLMESGDVAIFDESGQTGSGTGTAAATRSNTRGHHPSIGMTKRGDR
jgi:hypothetical protein